jgi:ribosomal protein L24E
MIEFKETGITTCVKTVYFDAQYLSSSVDILDEDTLYVSTKHNGVLFDCMYVNKDLKIVFMFNATGQKPFEHPLKPQTVENVKKAMKITENGYKVRLFYCVSSKMNFKKSIKNIDGIDIFIAKVKFLACDKNVI